MARGVKNSLSNFFLRKYVLKEKKVEKGLDN